jgi:hypothetical protein
MIKPVRKYSLTKVRELRANRKLLKTNGSSQIFQSDAEYQSFLGELKGAGHLQITGFNKMNVTIDSNHWNNKPMKNYEIQYAVGMENGDKPHFTGYIQSSSNADAKPYKVNAWLNEGGNIRIEIVEKK